MKLVWSAYLQRFSLSFGFFLGIVLLYAAAPDRTEEIRFDELALGKKTTVVMGAVAGIQVHCHDLDAIAPCLEGYQQSGEAHPVTLWLGNSQVHAINQYRLGEETAAPNLCL